MFWWETARRPQLTVMWYEFGVWYHRNNQNVVVVVDLIAVAMATYPSATQATTPLSSADNRDNQAPPIAAGAVFGDNAEEAKIEYKNRKRMREADPGSVTMAELKESRRRLCAIETVEAQVTHGMGTGAVLAAIFATNAAISNIRRRERNRNNDWTPILM